MKIWEQTAVVGIRPGFLLITPNEFAHSCVYSTLPTGMEATAEFSRGDTMLTGAAFGAVDYRVDGEICLDSIENGIVCSMPRAETP